MGAKRADNAFPTLPRAGYLANATRYPSFDLVAHKSRRRLREFALPWPQLSRRDRRFPTEPICNHTRRLIYAVWNHVRSTLHRCRNAAQTPANVES